MINKKRIPLLAAAAAGLLCFAMPSAHAGPTVYGGASSIDVVGPGQAHPNTDAARATFDAAASTTGTLTQLNFEASTIGSTTFLTNGVQITGVNNKQGVNINSTSTDPTQSPQREGFNTTPGGTKFLQLLSGNTSPVTETFAFSNANPITAFGATFTAIGTNLGTTVITFNDGTTQTETLAGNPLGGTEFFGFTDTPAGSSIKSVTLQVSPLSPGTNELDEIGIDDILIYNGTPSVPTLGVPEPSETATLAVGIVMLGGLVLLARKRRASCQSV